MSTSLSTEDQIEPERVEQLATAMSPAQIKKFLLYKRFFRTLIDDIRAELRAQVEHSFLSRIRERVKGSAAEVFAGLDAIIARIDTPEYENIGGFVAVSSTSKGSNKTKRQISAGVDISASVMKADIGASAKAGFETASEQSGDLEQKYVQLLMRIVGVNEIIAEIRKILAALGKRIRYLYVFLDDFSELPEEPMRLLVDSLISPLTRWSDFIKFKIAAYPGRVYLGSLDKTKIEEFHLDIYGLYGGSGVTKMEEKATDFVKRVVERRLSVFCKGGLDLFFNARSDDIWRVLFYATMANPRILGHIMLYAHESHLLYGKKIGPQAIQEAAQRYYAEKVTPFFSTGQYRTSFHERSSIFSWKELLEKMVGRARSIRQEDRSPRSGRDRSHSSHFYLSNDFEDLLSSLELAFFITKYFEQADRAGHRVSIYAFNYGLCMKYQIGFGRPAERREDRLYFVDRVFDYNSVIRSYMIANQEIACDKCELKFDITMLPAVKMLNMRCPTCSNGTCQVVNLSRKYGDMLEVIRPELLLPETELNILLLFTMKNERWSRPKSRES